MSKFIKHTIYLSIFVILQGCGTIGTYQSQCEKKYPEFSPMVDCLKMSVEKDIRFQIGNDSDLGKLYIAYANALKVKVRKGQVSEAEARLALASFYSRLKNESLKKQRQNAATYARTLEGLAAYESATRLQPTNVPITCVRTGNVVNCY